MDEEKNPDHQELIGKSVVDATGKVIGVCKDLVEGEDAYLIIEIETEETGLKKSKVPMETIQAIGEMIMLNVEVEGVIQDEKVVPFQKDEEPVSTEDEMKDSSDEKEETDKEEPSDDADKAKKKKEGTWVLFKSIKIKDHN